MINGELIVDNFAGGGGASTGIEEATGYCVDIAINHDPEAIKMLRENPGLDVGLHLVITSEWENVKWRPLTHCPSLTDENGYFYPMMFPNPAYPGQSIMEQKWDIKEIEQEFRAQIETTLKSIPQLSHLSGHMLSTGFSKEVNELVQRLAKEYNLPSIDRMDSSKAYRFTYIGYDGPKRTAEEKEASFIKALEKLQPGQRYLFLDHPALDNDEMKTVFHIGYEDVALDRQGVTDLLTSPRVRKAIEDKGIKLISINQLTKGLPRAAATPKLDKAMNRYLDAVKKAGQDLHSIMIVQHGNVIAEEWMGEGKEDEPHILNSVSKTFTATAVGLAASEGRLKLTDKVISFFPDKLPATVSENLAAMTVRDLLTMNCGHDTDPTGTVSCPYIGPSSFANIAATFSLLVSDSFSHQRQMVLYCFTSVTRSGTGAEEIYSASLPHGACQNPCSQRARCSSQTRSAKDLSAIWNIFLSSSLRSMDSSCTPTFSPCLLRSSGESLLLKAFLTSSSRSFRGPYSLLSKYRLNSSCSFPGSMNIFSIMHHLSYRM